MVLQALSLKRRLLLIVGLAGTLFLALGLIALQSIQPKLTEEVVAERAATLRLVLAERLQSKEDFGIGSAVALSREPAILDILQGGERAQGLATLESIIGLYRDSTNFQGLRIHVHDAQGHSVMRSWAPEQFGDDIRFRSGIRRMLEERQPFATLEVGGSGISIQSFAPLFDGSTYKGSLEVLQGVGSISRTFERDGNRYLLLLDAAAAADSPAIAGNTRVGDFVLAHNNWFSADTVDFARSMDLSTLAAEPVQRTADWFVVAEPLHDDSGRVIGLHLIGEPVAVLESQLSFVRTISSAFTASLARASST
ncbi:hypothetical protein CKO15_09510 [Halorhodospira abdelmalekii]|uniref:cache domain-containing protein n=1 Tax=Halorhodospira abdelmalekii TaxID=421629 RepID=UPI0019049D07|nr:cache domain-containing protein [Halorhodospira abdelmalekii]MBK1735516.1 hypothetical protein [Halorhodospira abdelmalekii]